jgi:hypothetical protein
MHKPYGVVFLYIIYTKLFVTYPIRKWPYIGFVLNHSLEILYRKPTSSSSLVDYKHVLRERGLRMHLTYDSTALTENDESKDW